MKFGISLWILLIGFCVKAQNSLSFSSLDSLLKYAGQHSSSIKTGDQQILLAKWTKITSIFNTVNIKSPFTASWVNNTQLPVSYLPAEAFGGPEGTFKQVSIGQQYVSNYAITPQIDIINPALWARIKSAEINRQLSLADQQLTKKNLFESIAAAYCNVLALQYQAQQFENYLTAADSLLIISENKFKAGIVREQDMNNMKINKLSVADKLLQINLQIEQNYNSIKILCDIKPETELKITESLESLVLDDQRAAASSLLTRRMQLQSAYLKNELKASRWQSFSPTLSLIFNQAWQANSNIGFTDSKANTFSAQYIGLRLTIPFPADPSRLGQNYSARISHRISVINSLHSELQEQLSNRNLDLDRQKAFSAYNSAKTISELKDINFSKSVNQYKEGILPAEILLNHFVEKINADLAMASTKAGLKLSQLKIKLNNSIQ
jgi:outer membrane protein